MWYESPSSRHDLHSSLDAVTDAGDFSGDLLGCSRYETSSTRRPLHAGIIGFQIWLSSDGLAFLGDVGFHCDSGFRRRFWSL
ncbi:hypothetical protein RchiOBHm_Chr6g0292321 [Rosa chinensis]|uniref:Uncharacterized protein n=1 Tax=Rosa chinensis TaxID=74649 RepID=A0A2P6PWC0_ROSCH|nr:hypothetical protein RchiOBHm_Chr6g0292321 [Rosa chinensis]